MRYTRAWLDHQISVINAMLGVDARTPGAIVLYPAYGGYGVHRFSVHGSGRESLLPCVTSRECARFLAGMVSALEIAQGRR